MSSLLRFATGSVRSAARATSKPIAYRLPFQARALSMTASLASKRTEVIRETEVPVSIYSPDSKGISASPDHFSIPVNGNAQQAATAADPESEEVVPLDPKVFKSMPPTLQKMTVMGKVIIVTG